MTLFLTIWVVIFAAASIFLTFDYARGGKMDDGSPMPLWFVLVFWCADLIVAWILLYLCFCRSIFLIEKEQLQVDRNVLFVRWSFTVVASSIHSFRQVQDGGINDDSFPSWGLWVQERRLRALLRRLPIEDSLWLGQTLANWYEVGFIPAEGE